MTWVDVGGLTAGATKPTNGQGYLPVRQLPGKDVWRTTFSSAVSNGVDTAFWDLIQTGSGQTVNQTGGNLVVTTGTTTNAETIIRSKQSWQAYTYVMSWAALLSQRIANQNFFIELVDVIGDGLSYTINSATSVTVTFPTSNPFTSANVGQSMYLGKITGAAGIPMRAAIASVSGLTVTFTVAGWPATGSGTLSLFGWNYHQVLYDGTTATSTKYDAQRKGFNSGFTAATINTTASPGHFGQIFQEESIALFSDASPASATTFQTTQRASRLQNIPNNEPTLFFQIRVLNGSTAPASTTTLTVNFAAFELVAVTPVVVENASQVGAGAAMPVQVMGGSALATQPVSGSLTSAGTTTNTPAAPTNYNVVSAASTNAAVVKATAGSLYEVTVSNVTATPIYVKFYNKATAPTVGTDVPILTLPVPANTTLSTEFGAVGKRFATGIGVAATAAAVATDTGVAVAGVQINASYI